jgi:hypothetical protein
VRTPTPSSAPWPASLSRPSSALKASPSRTRLPPQVAGGTLVAVPRIIPPTEFRAQPWKNGGGVTHEILRWPDASADDYQLRISLAEDRAAAPFSRFPGYRRWSFLADAAPIQLDVAGTPHALTALGDVLEIDGDVPITCTLPAGPTRLLTFLVRHDTTLFVGRGPTASPIGFVFALSDLPWLPAGHAAIFDPPEVAALDENAIWLR